MHICNVVTLPGLLYKIFSTPLRLGDLYRRGATLDYHIRNTPQTFNIDPA